MDFGVLPFEICRLVASVVLAVFFSALMWRHRRTVMPVHYMIMGVVVLGTVGALSWLTAYSYMNSTGEGLPRVEGLGLQCSLQDSADE